MTGKEAWQNLARWYKKESGSPIRIILDVFSLGYLVFVVCTFFAKVGLVYSLVLTALLIILWVGSRLALRKIDTLERLVASKNMFETELVQCLRDSTEQTEIIIKELHAYFTVLPNGDLHYFDTLVFTNEGPRKPPVRWFAWHFFVDENVPALRSLSELKAGATNIEPAGLTVFLHVDSEGNRTVRQFFFFPEPVQDTPRKIKSELTWPGYFGHLLRMNQDKVGFVYEPTRKTIESLAITVRIHKKIGGFVCTKDREAGSEVILSNSDAPGDRDFDIYTWTIDKLVKGTEYYLRITRP